MSADELWEQLCSYSDSYTCYSAAVATWAAHERADWAEVVDPGLWLTVYERPGGLFAFGHFPPALRARLGLARTGSEHREHAHASVLEELERSGRVIVAGDGFRLPWHVAFGRRHVPHWFVLFRSETGPVIVDPFACRRDPCAKRCIPGRANCPEQLGYDDLLAAVSPRLARIGRSQPMQWDRFALTQNVNERFEVVLQIEYCILQLSQWPDSHQNNTVQWTSGSETSGCELKKRTFCQRVGEL